jgi:hypothetical protein
VELPHYNITPMQLAKRKVEAEAELTRIEEAWKKRGAQKIDPQAINKQHEEVQQLDVQFRECQTQFLNFQDKWLRAHHAVDALKRSSHSWRFVRSRYFPFVVSFFGVLVCLLLGFLLGAIVRIELGLVAVWTVFCLVTLVIIWWSRAKDRWIPERINKIDGQIPKAEWDLKQTVKWKESAIEARDCMYRTLAEARNRYEQMEILTKFQQAHEEAQRNYHQICELMESKRFNLYHSNWRDLEGIPFENFLKDVFEMLGYIVETTPRTGDQGLDLILTGKGKKIGIQAKGYDENNIVGNEAIREAHFGKDFYHCQSCAVITTSDFTKKAREAAEADNVRCRLISGKDIPDLIMGKTIL